MLVDRTKTLLAGEEFPRTSLLDLANYASFFPQIVAGPIEREKNLVPQLRKFSFELKLENLVPGLKFIVLGLFYKLVMADNLAASSPWVHQEIEHPVLIHLCNVIFGLRIYGDFAGYSFIALGIARIFGVILTINFLSPYSRNNIQEFWRAWHISLTNWFRDYIYIPLGGNRVIMTILAVFFVSGVWHGAGWGFIAWGLMHGLMVMLCVSLKGRVKLPKLIGWALTIVFVSVAWLPFYQWDNTILLEKMKALLDTRAYLSSPMGELDILVKSKASLFYLAISIGIGCACIGLESLSRLRLEKNGDSSRLSPYYWSFGTPAQIIMVFAIMTLSPAQNNGFVYFNF